MIYPVTLGYTKNRQMLHILSPNRLKSEGLCGRKIEVELIDRADLEIPPGDVSMLKYAGKYVCAQCARKARA